MPEKVTSLNGLKVTLVYCSYIANAVNLSYVKCNLIRTQLSPHVAHVWPLPPLLITIMKA